MSSMWSQVRQFCYPYPYETFDPSFDLSHLFHFDSEHFPSRSRLRGGVYLVESLPTTHNGKLIRRQITELATEMFKTAKENDPDIQSYLKDIPEEFRKLI